MDTIKAVFNQRCKTYELIVVDDGSTDSTEKIIAKYSNSVRSFKQQNSGEAIAVNFGIQQSIGDYVCIVNADDLIAKDLLRNSINILDVNPKIVVTYPDWNMVDEFGELLTLEKALIEQFRKELQSAYDMSDGGLAGLFSVIGLTETSKYDIKKAELEILRDHIDKELAELRNANKVKKAKKAKKVKKAKKCKN
jgi:glycosyltransferase involved in cell wall biosynthesis